MAPQILREFFLAFASMCMVLLACFAFPALGYADELPVFPGAEGFGSLTPAGRGGQVIKVTNLQDSGPGSLRAAIETPGPRIVVFEVGGGIHLEAALDVKDPYLTIAGQTAPFPGISLIGFGIKVATHDVLIQHLYVRIVSPRAEDGIQLKAVGKSRPFNVVVDHVSVAWANDENISCFHDSASDITFSNCLLGEGHYGMLIAEGSVNISVLRNLFMSAKERHPRIASGTSVQVVNNLSYNVGSYGSTVVGSKRGGALVSFAGNLYLDGPDTGKTSYGIRVYDERMEGNSLYLPGVGPHSNLASGRICSLPTLDFLVSKPPIPLDAVTIGPVEKVERSIIANAGARPAERLRPDGDVVDRRLITELVMRGGSVKDRFKPAYAKPVTTYRPFELPDRPQDDDDGDGYTNVEEVLHRLAWQLEN